MGAFAAGFSVNARWFDPTNGTYTQVAGSPFAATGSQVFAPPGNNSQGQTDWVIIFKNDMRARKKFRGDDLTEPVIRFNLSLAFYERSTLQSRLEIGKRNLDVHSLQQEDSTGGEPPSGRWLQEQFTKARETPNTNLHINESFT